MKKLLLILIVALPMFAMCQNQVTLNSGTIFIGKIDGFYGTNLVFTKTIKTLGVDRVPISDVKAIAGKMPKSRQKAILKKNPDVQFFTDKTKFEDPIYFNADQKSDTTKGAYIYGSVEPYYKNKTTITPDYSSGDYLYRAGKRYLTGLGVTTGGALLTSIFASSETPELAYIGLGVSLTGIIISITGHIQLMEAGKALNREAITLSAAPSGIGLAINF